MHYLITGTSGCGKSTLASNLAQMYAGGGYSTIVYDPMNDARWPAGKETSFKTADFEEFMQVYSNSRNCRVFIDECKTLDLPENKRHFALIGAYGRHLGHVGYYIGHRAKWIPIPVRCICVGVFAFRQGPKDAIELSEDFAQKGLRDVENLQLGEYLFSDKFTISKGKVF